MATPPLQPALLQQLAQLFPGTPTQHLQQALQIAGMDLEQAAANMLDAAPSSSAPSARSAAATSTSTSAPTRKAAANNRRGPHGIKHTWAQLEQPQAAPMPYMTSGQQPQLPGSDAFPDLAPAGPSDRPTGQPGRTGALTTAPYFGSNKSSAAPAAGGKWGRGSRTPEPKAAPPQPRSLARRSASATTFADVAKVQEQQQQARMQQQLAQQQHKQRQQEQQQHQAELLSEPDGVKDANARHAVPSGVTTPAECVASSQQGRDDAAAQLAMQHSWADPGLVLAVLHAVAFDIGDAQAALADMGGAHVGEDMHPSGAAGSGAGQAADAVRILNLPSAEHIKVASQPGGRHEKADLYHVHRRDAIKLSHAWHKAVRRAATAFSAGDHSNGRWLAQQSHGLRQQALEAHAMAASRIEVEMNKDKNLTELDLHGLHTSEAVEALQRRLDLLQRTLSPLEQHMSLQKQGRTCELRVIVGRGNNSSDGEASLPRAVQAFLINQGYNYRWRGGAVDIHVRRSKFGAAVPSVQTRNIVATRT